MATQLHPYLHFKDNARQAMEFYQSVFGGEVSMSTFADYHATEDPAYADKIMHAKLEGKNGISFMAADTPPEMGYQPTGGFSMTLSGEDEQELCGYFEKLSQGGQVVVPLEKSPWGDTFGMLVDAFGVDWMVNINEQEQPP